MDRNLAAALRAQARALELLADAIEQLPGTSADDLVWIGALAERKGIEKLIAAGKLRSAKIGRKLFVSKSDLLRLLDAPQEKATIYSLKDAIAARGGR
jgi:hypothetical protein